MRLVIIGGGNMGGAILLAILRSESVPPEDILLIETDSDKRQKICNATGCSAQAEIDEALRCYDIVLLSRFIRPIFPALSNASNSIEFFKALPSSPQFLSFGSFIHDGSITANILVNL